MARRWIELLEQRYGVTSDFAGHLAPLLEQIARRDLPPSQWEPLLGGIAAAYRASCAPRGATDPDELHALVEQFTCELRKVDEALKVLDVCMQRIGRRARHAEPPGPRVLH